MKYFCIDIASDFLGKEKYWYDWIHTTPEGSKVLSETIYPELIKHIQKIILTDNELAEHKKLIGGLKNALWNKVGYGQQ